MHRKIELRNKIVEKLITAYNAESSRKNINRYFDRKFDIILTDLARTAFSPMEHSMFPGDRSIKMYAVAEKRRLWGMITIDGQQKEAVDLLLPFFAVEMYQGSQGIAKAIKFREATMDALMELAVESSEFKTVTQQAEIPEGALYFSTPVDAANLKAYISELDAKMLREPNEDKRIKLAHEKMIGNTVLASLNESGELDQEVYIADSGRIYLRGLNLLNAPRNLRHAALGTAHLYDMRVGAFGVMAALASTYSIRNGIECRFHTIREYIARKDQTRMLITRSTYPDETKNFRDINDYKKFFGYYNVKVALTAIGFGAKRSARAAWRGPNNEWRTTSLLDSFKGNRNELDRFLACPKVQALSDEYTEATKIVLLMLEQEPEFAGLFNLSNANSPAKKAALVYQTIEQHIINKFMQCSGAELLMPAHDGVYVKHSIDYPSAWSQLEHQWIDDWGFIQFDHTKYVAREHAGAALGKEYSHAQFIAQQEELARDYAPRHSSLGSQCDAPRQVMTPWGLVDANVYESLTAGSPRNDRYFQDEYFNSRY